MIQVRFTADARIDLRDTYQYLRSLPQAPALRIGHELRQAVENICLLPRIGRVDEEQTELAGEPVYRFVSGQYIVFYSVEPQHILILGVLHGKRDVDAIMNRRKS